MKERLKEGLEKSASLPGPVRVGEMVGGMILLVAAKDVRLAGLGALIVLHGAIGPLGSLSYWRREGRRGKEKPKE